MLKQGFVLRPPLQRFFNAIFFKAAPLQEQKSKNNKTFTSSHSPLPPSLHILPVPYFPFTHPLNGSFEALEAGGFGFCFGEPFEVVFFVGIAEVFKGLPGGGVFL